MASAGFEDKLIQLLRRELMPGETPIDTIRVGKNEDTEDKRLLRQGLTAIASYDLHRSLERLRAEWPEAAVNLLDGVIEKAGGDPR